MSYISLEFHVELLKLRMIKYQYVIFDRLLSYQTIKNGKWNTFKPVLSVRSIFKSDSLIVSVLFSVMVATNIDRLPYTVFQVLTDNKLYPGFSLSLNHVGFLLNSPNHDD